MNSSYASDPEVAAFQAAAERHRSGDNETALQLCDRMLGIGPSACALPAILNLKAVILAGQGCLIAAADCIRQALEASPALAALHDHAARIHAALGRMEAALAAAESACRLAPDNVVYRYQLARILRLADDWSGAVREAEACLAVQPGFDEARILRSELAAGQGDPRRAVEWLRTVVEHDPDHVRGWAMLSAHDPELVTELPVERELTRLADAELDADAAATAKFAVAHRALRDGEPDRAFDLFRAANELRASVAPFDIEGWERRVARILAASGSVERPGTDSAVADGAGRRLVFIVGMPRSGTTLCEQVLSAHPDVFGAGELPGMEQIRNELLRRSVDPDTAGANPEWLGPMRATYLDLLPHRSAGHARVIDKAPRNFERVGLILQLFPAARVIWMLRHPLDTVLSCYEQDFGPGQAFSNRLDHAARVHVGHARLLREALRCHGDSVLVVDYARLVTQLEAVAREMAGFIGIDYHPAMLEPQRNPRQVRTASAEQVRQPVYTSAIDRWRLFADRLAPARRVFENAGLIDAEGGSRVATWLAEAAAGQERPATPR